VADEMVDEIEGEGGAEVVVVAVATVAAEAAEAAEGAPSR